MLEEIEFHRLAKLRLEVDAPDDMYDSRPILSRLMSESDCPQ